jgi:hypothetical protein
MAILNYTTDVPAERSINQIQKTLTQHGAREILIANDEEGNVIGMAFKVKSPEGVMSFRLPANIEAVYKVLVKQKKYRGWNDEERYKEQNLAQAQRVAWRILKDWVEAQMAILETQMVELDQVFLPYAITRLGNTLYQEMKDSGHILLGGGS